MRPSQEEIIAHFNRLDGLAQEAAFKPESLVERVAGKSTAAESAVEKARNREPLNDDELNALEAIIIPEQRPAIRIYDGDFTITHPLWLPFNSDPLKAALKALLPSVGRIDLPKHPSYPYGGTGFVVGENLIMTNRHVAEIFTAGLGETLVFNTSFGTGIDFLREDENQQSRLLLIQNVEMIHPFWDMALLKVEGLGKDHPILTLSVTPPDALLGKNIAVVGYPAFDPRNNTKVQNQVFEGVYNVKRLQPGVVGARADITSFGHSVSALTHDSSTLGGNSGSVVFDPATQEVVALHFAGLYLKANYCVPAAELGLDGRVIDAGVRFTSNTRRKTTPWESYWRNTEAPPPVPKTATATLQSPMASVQQFPQPANPSGSEVSLTIPVQISVRFGAAVSGTAAMSGTAAVSAAIEKAMEPQHDDEEAARDGYDKDFLSVTVPLPSVKDKSLVALTRDGRDVLDYHHFSLSMHKQRRLALFTAANLDYSEEARKPDPRKKYDRKSLTGLGPNDMEKWFTDPRLDLKYQLPDRFYTKDDGAFDKGHIVRREDVAWGKTYDELRMANGDTYHVTNCSPQVANFNRSAQGEDNWGDLENYVMNQGKTERLSLFAGPALQDNDQIFVGVNDKGPARIRIPQSFWKVVLAVTDGRLHSYAFSLEQDLSDVPLEFVVDAAWQKYMVSITELEEKLLVRFPAEVHDADQSGTPAGESLRAVSGAKLRKTGAAAV